MDTIDIKHYTVSELRSWLEHNITPEGLTNEVIRPSFAWALIHHPDVLENDPIVAALFDHGQLAASTCAFPEIMVKPDFLDEHGQPKRVWWFPMLWCKPEYRGKGYGLVVIGSLAEVYGTDSAWTAWAVQESIEIFEFLGCKTYYFPRYFMGEKNINANSFKGKLAFMKQRCQKWWHSHNMPTLTHYDYSLRYLNNVDDESYDFICKHCTENFFLSSQGVLNWLIQYPWNISAPLEKRVPKNGTYFAEITPLILFSFVQVWSKEQLVGVYRLRRNENKLTCDFIYYDNASAEIVFASVVEHILNLKATHFDTEDGNLAAFVRKYIYFQKCTTEQLSLSIAPTIPIPEHLVR